MKASPARRQNWRRNIRRCKAREFNPTCAGTGENSAQVQEPEGGQIAEPPTEQRTGQDIGEEMQAEQDAGSGNIDGEKQQQRLDARISVDERGSDGEGGERMSGGEGVTIERARGRGAAGLGKAGAAAAAAVLENFKGGDAQRGGGGTEGRPARGTAMQNDRQPDHAPENAVAGAGRDQHPASNPARRAPAFNPRAQPMI